MDVTFVANLGHLSEHEANLWAEWATENVVKHRMREADGGWQLVALVSSPCDAIQLRRKLRTLADKWGSPLPPKLGHGWVKIFGEEEFHAMTQEEDVRKDGLPLSEVGSFAHRYGHAPEGPTTSTCGIAACGASVLSPSFAADAREKLQLLLGK